MSIPDHHIWFADSQEPEGPYQTRILLQKPLFEDQKSTHRLIISIEHNRLRYVLLSPQGEWVKAKSFESTGLLSQENFLRFLLEKETLLSETFAEVQVFLGESSFFLVPDAYLEERYHTPLGRLLIDDQLFDDELYQIALNFMDAHLFLNFKPVLKHILDHYVRDYQVMHPMATVLSIGHRHGTKRLESYVLFEGNQVLISLFDQGRLVMANSYTCRTEVDVLYYIQLVRQISGYGGEHLQANFLGEQRWGTSIPWESYGIHWAEVPLAAGIDPYLAKQQDLTSWRYLVV